MGCDIHCYVEYKEYDRWWSWGSRINPGRNYNMFEFMAGVRGWEENRIIPDRGLPEDLATSSQWDYWLFVGKEDSEGVISPETAQDYLECGSIEKYFGDIRTVSNPDWHTPNWCTSEELDKCIDVVSNYVYGYKALSAAMKAYPESRLVYWFDN